MITNQENKKGVAEGMKPEQISKYAEELVSKKGHEKALEYALMMANLGRDSGWLPVIRYIKSMKQGVAEGIRMAKDGIEECWTDMEGQAMTQGNAGGPMSVTISMPGKNINVTADSADEIGNILRLAGINVGGVVSGDVDGDGDHDMADHEAEESPDFEMADRPAEESPDEFMPPEESPDFVHPYLMDKDTAHQMGEQVSDSARILQLAGIAENTKLMNSPAGTSMDEPMEFDSLPSEKGTGAGRADYGTRQSNMGGDNPMGLHTPDMEESFQAAMGEYRKFVAENISKIKESRPRQPIDVVAIEDSDSGAYYHDENNYGPTIKATLKRGSEFVEADGILSSAWSEEDLNDDVFDEWKSYAKAGDKGYKYWRE